MNARSSISRGGQVRHQLYMSAELSERLAALAKKPGVTMSSILAEALGAWLDRKGVSELQERFGVRLDNLSRAVARIERNSQIEIEILALLARYLLTSIPPVAEGDDVGRAQGRERFEWFTMKVAEAFRDGRGSFGVEMGQ
ncbi:CopG family transcriptional regulator [Sphingopyxis sp. PAMC25046]|uniref:CopG family transcriptional regulator n=1 Tax=Sphingopyxis sp. PAMC25046 TaxID=2565556 RepID=UPI00109E0381|nr:CopG family transcriptional regulator [Sphingopyxis sp. PAMC25046]QCB55771.1 CopG family transcriptional regulator [Sphingopyxis sp. PAMC25046]